MDLKILKKPLISEKSFQMAAAGKFSFQVDKKADKFSIAEVIKELFNVEVVSVNVTNYVGKVKRGKKGMGKRSNFKKAFVTLKSGQKIDLFEIEKPKDEKKSKAESKAKETKEDKETTVKVREKGSKK